MPIRNSHQPIATPSAAVAAARPTNSGHQLCGLKNPSSPVPWSISPSRLVLRPRRQPPAGEQQVEADQEGQADGQRERGGARSGRGRSTSRRCRTAPKKMAQPRNR